MLKKGSCDGKWVAWWLINKYDALFANPASEAFQQRVEHETSSALSLGITVPQFQVLSDLYSWYNFAYQQTVDRLYLEFSRRVHLVQADDKKKTEQVLFL